MTDHPVRSIIEPGSPLVLAHRGAAAERPENTMAAFDRAVEMGSDGIEMDVWVTADGIPVVIHDPSTGRIGDTDIVVEASPLTAIQTVDAGYRYSPDDGGTHPWRGRGLRVPALAEVLERLPQTAILLELKSARGQAAVRAVLDSQEAWRRVVVASSLHWALTVFRDGKYHRSASRREVAWWYFGSSLGLWTGSRGYCTLSIPERKGPFDLVTRRSMDTAARAGIPVHVWTVDDAVVARRLWQAGATGIISNVPDRILAERTRGNPA